MGTKYTFFDSENNILETWKESITHMELNIIDYPMIAPATRMEIEYCEIQTSSMD